MSVPRWMIEDAQETLFNEDKFIYQPIYGGGVTNTVIGQFFEQVAAHMLNCKVELPVNTEWATYPDLIKWDYKGRDVLIEVKATHRNPLIMKNQMEAYRKMQMAPFPFTNAKVYYVIFFYTIHHFHLHFSRYHDLFKALAQDIQVCYILPIDIMEELIKSLVPLASSWRNILVRWKLPIDRLLREASKDKFLEAFETLSGLNGITYLQLNNLKLRKFFINGLKVIDYNIKKFPVIMVSDKGETLDIKGVGK
jgi:hypothetical protein